MTQAKDKPTIPAAVAKGRAPEIDPRAAAARDAALAAVSRAASDGPAEPKPTPPAAPSAPQKKDA